jgi:hypothetical protein
MVALSVGAARAQTETTRKEVELSRQDIQTKRKEIVAEALPLTSTEAEKFWPLYQKYRDDMSRLLDPMINRMIAYDENPRTLTGGDYRKLVDDYLKLEKSRIEMQQKYVKQFAQVLPPAKLARFFQIENKMDAVLKFGLAMEMPAISTGGG